VKILFASCIQRSHSTGMGKWTARVAHELRTRGHAVRELYGDDLLGPGRFRRHVFGPTLAVWLLRNRGQVDVAVIHEPNAASAALLHRVHHRWPAVVAMSHGVETRITRDLRRASLEGLSSTDHWSVARHELLWAWREALAFRVASSVLCLSEADQIFLAERVGVDPRKVFRLVNGVDPPIGRAEPEKGSVVLCIGSWIEEKGSRVLPRLWREVRQRRPSARLFLAGTGVPLSEVVEAFDPDDRASVEVMRSFATPEDVDEQFRRAALFLLPSLREGSPLALLEAMIRGLPVVAANVGGVPEIVTNAREGYLYPPLSPGVGAERVASLLGDPPLRVALGAAARERALPLTWARAADVVERACLEASGSST